MIIDRKMIFDLQKLNLKGTTEMESMEDKMKFNNDLQRISTFTRIAARKIYPQGENAFGFLRQNTYNFNEKVDKHTAASVNMAGSVMVDRCLTIMKLAAKPEMSPTDREILKDTFIDLIMEADRLAATIGLNLHAAFHKTLRYRAEDGGWKPFDAPELVQADAAVTTENIEPVNANREVTTVKELTLLERLDAVEKSLAVTTEQLANIRKALMKKKEPQLNEQQAAAMRNVYDLLGVFFGSTPDPRHDTKSAH